MQQFRKKINSKWAKVEVPHHNSRRVSEYKIMRFPVQAKNFSYDLSNKNDSVSSSGAQEKGKKRRRGNPVTKVPFPKADDYCFQKYGGSVSPIYVFEWALRDGLLFGPGGSTGKEIVAPYDPEFGDDIFHRPGDKLQTKTDEKRTSVEKVVQFDWKREEYWAVGLSHKGSAMTFRCAREI